MKAAVPEIGSTMPRKTHNAKQSYRRCAPAGTHQFVAASATRLQTRALYWTKR
jgi:hypothetical protein